MSIYISTSCVKSRQIKDSIRLLAEIGFKNIELSGGTRFYDAFKKDLIYLKEKYSLNYMLHNYFPPPENPFVINLASENNKVYEQSIKHCIEAINLTKEFQCNRFSVHAGFLMDIKTGEIGKKLSLNSLAKREIALERFESAWKILCNHAGKEVNLYLENNVFSHTNNKTYKNKNPFFLTNYSEYLELKERFNFTILLDFAHLQVSAKTLGLDFFEQAKKLFPLTDYIHLSDNDGFHDQNKGLIEDGQIINFLKHNNIRNKTVTIEIYSGIDSIIDSYEKISELN